MRNASDMLCPTVLPHLLSAKNGEYVMPRVHYPKPHKRFKSRSWEIYWKWNNRRYAVSPGYAQEEEDLLVEADLRQIAAALASPAPVFPDKYAQTSAVIRYLEDRFGIVAQPDGEDVPSPEKLQEKWIADYAVEIKGECSARWAKLSIATLRVLEAAVGDLSALTPLAASQYLAGIAATRKEGTRNSALSIFSRFYNWVIRTERATIKNPFAGTKRLDVEESLDIVYCTPEERDEVIAFAESTGRREWLAVPIAFYAGMRREEIARLEWPDVRLTEGKILVRKTKTKKGRIIPLNATLETLLLSIPAADRYGFVVKIPAEVDRLWRMDNLVRTVQKMKRDALMAAWNITKPSPSRSKEYAAKKKEYEAVKKERKAALDTALGRISWNPFRHTFGSLLAQANVSIDKISAWMGNTPEVCRRHYAQFIPRDRRDDEIDRL